MLLFLPDYTTILRIIQGFLTINCKRLQKYFLFMFDFFIENIYYKNVAEMFSDYFHEGRRNI